MNRYDFTSTLKKPELTHFFNQYYDYHIDEQGRKQGTAFLSLLGRIEYQNDVVISVDFGKGDFNGTTYDRGVFDEKDYSIQFGSGHPIFRDININNYSPFFEGYGKRNVDDLNQITIGVGWVRLVLPE